MLKWNKILLMALALVVTISTMAQDAAAKVSDNEDFMRSNNKIFVVVAIVLTILIGLIIYVARLDSKIGKLEKDKH